MGRIVTTIIIAALIFHLSVGVDYTIETSPTEGKYDPIPRTTYLTLAVRVWNINDTYSYQDVQVTLDEGYNHTTFEFISSKTVTGNWTNDTFVQLGTIGPKSKSIAVFKIKAIGIGEDKQIILRVNSTNFTDQNKTFTMNIDPKDKDSSFWRVPVSVNTMWSGRTTASARIEFPSDVRQDALEVRDGNYRRIDFQVFDWEDTASGKEATLVWTLDDTTTFPPFSKRIKFYWIRYPLERQSINPRNYTLEVICDQNLDGYCNETVELSGCIDSADAFEDEIDDNDSNWTRLHRWEDRDVWEMDFIDSTNASYGEDLTLGVDGSALSYYCGHVNKDDALLKLTLANIKRTTRYVHPENVSLGTSSGGNLKYIGFDTCLLLNDTSWEEWGESMSGIHLIMGFDTEVGDSDVFAGYWADYMIDDGILNPVYPVWQSWRGACYWAYGSGKTARALYMNATCLDDYLDGQGSSCTEPEGNGTVMMTEYDCSSIWW